MSKKANNALDPSASPQTVNMGTRRVNNLPIIGAVGGVMAFAVIIAVVAAGRSQQQTAAIRDQDKPHSSKSALMVGRQIAGDASSGVIERKAAPLPPPPAPLPEQVVTVGAAQPAQPQPIPTDVAPIQIQRPENLDAPPPPPQETNGEDGLTQAENTMAQAKLSQFTQAVTAHTAVDVAMSRSPGSRPSEAESSEASSIQAKLAALRQRINHADDDASPNVTSDATSAELAKVRAQVKKQEADPNGGGSEDDNSTQEEGDNNTRNSVGKFNGQSSRWRLNNSVEAPESPYELRTGNIIPATLISGINSELPGLITAQVSQNVYDTATGRHLLIPQGSRLIGQYNSQVAFGQNRVLVAWQRIIFPDAKALDIGAMSGADFAGYSGLKDQVDNHFLRIFGSAILMSGITAGVNYTQNQSQGNSNGYNMNSSSVLSQSLGQGMGEAMQQLFQRNLNISPTLTIRPGFRLNVMVNKDLVFSKPYQNFDY